MGKAFEKQIKTNWRSRRKTNKSNSRSRQVKTIKNYTSDAEGTRLILKQKELFNELANERLEKITDLDKILNSNDLIYKYKGNTADKKFDKFDNVLNIINKIQNGEISLVDVKNNQEKFKSHVGEIKRGNSKKRSKEPKSALYNIEMIYKARSKAIKFYDDYSSIMSEVKTKAKAKATKGTRIKILIPKQMLQR